MMFKKNLNIRHCPIVLRRLSMSRKAIILIIIFSLLFLLGVNTGDIEYLMDLGNTICLACIGVG